MGETPLFRDVPVKRSFVRTGLVSVLAAGLIGGCVNLDDLNDDPNVGPCPVAGVLYDANRVAEVKGVERHENVGFTGQIERVRGFCRYIKDNPITMEIEIDFAFGRGPKAEGDTHTYPYFVSVTRRDRNVLAKDVSNITVKFPKGADVVRQTEKVDGIVIPRATPTVSGTNFEVIAGFELTPDELAYNRSGKRFTINTGE
jgi:hypothetical protein